MAARLAQMTVLGAIKGVCSIFVLGASRFLLGCANWINGNLEGKKAGCASLDRSGGTGSLLVTERAMSSRVVAATYDAVGGPSKLVQAADGYWAGPTDPGQYRVAKCGRHSSPSYPVWSKIRWGSDIKETGGKLFVMHNGAFKPLSELSPTLSKDDIKQRHKELYGKYEVPPKWVFNDFGHMTCYFYKDLNNNKKLDGKEHIHTEYFHTTPDNEAQQSSGQPVTLGESHGCIHLKPVDIDDLIAKSYFKSGNKVVVHKAGEKVPKWDSDPAATAPFEVHFFQGEKKLVVTGQRSKRKTP